MTVNITGFQRARRLAKEKAAKKAQEATGQEQELDGMNGQEEQNGNESGQGGQDNEQEKELGDMTYEEIADADIEDVKKLLDLYEVKYAHNTGEDKLRERLKDAING